MTHNIGSWGPEMTSSRESLPGLLKVRIIVHEKVLALIKVLKLLLVQSQTIYNRLTRRLKRLATWTDRTDTIHTWR